MANIGIFSGTFDPVHTGHIAFALAAIHQANLERVIFLPERHPRNKLNVTPFNSRLDMIKLAIQNHPFFGVAELEEEQFTVAATLCVLQQRYGRDLSLLIGADVAATLHSWPEIDQLVKKMEFVVALRHGDSEAEIVKTLEQTGARFTCFVSPNKEAASRKVRTDGLKEYLDPGVQAYIVDKGLYPVAFGTN